MKTYPNCFFKKLSFSNQSLIDQILKCTHFSQTMILFKLLFSHLICTIKLDRVSFFFKWCCLIIFHTLLKTCPKCKSSLLTSVKHPISDVHLRHKFSNHHFQQCNKLQCKIEIIAITIWLETTINGEKLWVQVWKTDSRYIPHIYMCVHNIIE
jgi:hypothetical protein